MTDKIIAITHTGSPEEARTIARALVERKLAAAVNIIVGVESTYWWKGNIETAAECTLLIKSTRTNFEAICDAIRELHSYELPECVAISIESGSPQYLTWIAESLKS
jgi:periplasmic divalent cation tolerance protein